MDYAAKYMAMYIAIRTQDVDYAAKHIVIRKEMWILFGDLSPFGCLLHTSGVVKTGLGEVRPPGVLGEVRPAINEFFVRRIRREKCQIVANKMLLAILNGGGKGVGGGGGRWGGGGGGGDGG